MNIKYPHLTIIFLLVLGLTAVNTALAQRISVNSANPASAVRGTLSLDVEISGNGFDETVHEVIFLLPCASESCVDDDGDVKVRDFTVNGRKKITATIDVLETAVISNFDIRVSASRGRGGKGTTLFSVRSQAEVTFKCDEVFGIPGSTRFPPPQYPESCNCEFTASPSTPHIMGLVADCDTYETLYLDQYWFNNLGSGATITARGPFSGDAVIASTWENAGFRYSSIHLDDSINDGVGAGCEPGQLKSVIRYVLDADSTPAVYHTYMVGDHITMTAADGVSVCHAIDARHESGFDDNGFLDSKIFIDENEIADGIYEKTGILFRGFGPVPGNLAELSVSTNTIGTPAAGPGVAQANAIQFGPGYGPGTVERNNISASGGTGILLLGGDSAMEMKVGHNDVVGASVGILVDENVPYSRITSNYLVGDQNESDIGICQALRNRTKPNTFVDLADNVLTDDVVCPQLAEPAAD